MCRDRTCSFERRPRPSGTKSSRLLSTSLPCPEASERLLGTELLKGRRHHTIPANRQDRKGLRAVPRCDFLEGACIASAWTSEGYPKDDQSSTVSHSPCSFMRSLKMPAGIADMLFKARNLRRPGNMSIRRKTKRMETYNCSSSESFPMASGISEIRLSNKTLRDENNESASYKIVQTQSFDDDLQALTRTSVLPSWQSFEELKRVDSTGGAEW